MPFVPPACFVEVPPDIKYYESGEDRSNCCIDWLMYLRTASLLDQTKYCDDFFKHIRSHDEKPVKVGNGLYQGAFAFTLNKSDKDPFTVGDMLIAVRKVMAQKSQPVKQYAWYYEDKGRDANGDAINPHIHGMYETLDGKKIESKHFKRAWDIWNPKVPLGSGFRGGYHRPVKHDEAYSQYIKKDGGMSECLISDEI